MGCLEAQGTRSLTEVGLQEVSKDGPGLLDSSQGLDPKVTKHPPTTTHIHDYYVHIQVYECMYLNIHFFHLLIPRDMHTCTSVRPHLFPFIST